MSDPVIEVPGPTDDDPTVAANPTPTAPAQLPSVAPVAAPVTMEALMAQLAKLQAKVEAQAAELEAAKAGPGVEAVVFEPVTPHAEQHRLSYAEYQGYTCADLTREVLAGRVLMTEPHVLCADGWLVNPRAA